MIINRSSQNIFNNWAWEIDKLNVFLILFLLIFGTICVTSGSFGVAKKIDVNSGYFIIKHIYYVIFAIFTIIFISMFDENFIYKISLPLFSIFLFLVCLTFFVGTEIKGSKRWLYFFGISIQPSEFLKIMFIPVNAIILSNLNYFHHIKIYIVSFFFCILTILSVIIQPDIGMSLLIFFSWIIQIFISGIPLILLFIPLFLFIFFCGFAYIFFEHVQYRVNNFIKSFGGESEQLYQVKQAIKAFEKGKLFGVGPGQGKIKINLPDAHTDFIFSVIAEEFGTISCFLIISIYILILWRSLSKIFNENDLFKIFTIAGLSFQFIIQAFINIGVNIRLLPAKGMTLPLISYGGSSTLASGLLFGIIISLNRKKYGYLNNKVSKK
jgi:cell division protein FtsW